MPSTRRSLGGGALQTVNSNVPPPVTPGTKVRKMQAELDKKDSENEALRASIQNLTSVLGKLDLVKAADPVVNPTEVNNNKKKDPKAPVPAKTAYKFFCDVTPAQDNMQKVWKETDAKKREPFVLLAAADKERYQNELAAYNQEKKALDMYYEKKKQDQAMAFFEAHMEAQAALKEVESAKGKKTAKDPDAPKRPTSSYMYFAKEVRADVVAKNPSAKPTEVTKIMGAMWKELDARKMKKFEKMAEADRERYAGEKAVYDAKVAAKKEEAEQEEVARLEQEKKEAMELLETTTKQMAAEFTIQSVGGEDMSVVSDLSGKSKKKKDPNAPKRALTAYNFFFTENRESIKSKMPADTKNQELMSEVGRQWKALSESKKKKYNKMAEKDKVRYANEMAVYNANKPE